MSRTSVLTILTLDIISPSPTPTTSQSFPILTSNPTLQKLTLAPRAVPDGCGNETPFRVKLHHLKELQLEGHSEHAVKNLDLLSFALRDFNIIDIPKIIGPYLQDHLRRRDRPQGGLNLRVSSGELPKRRGCNIGFQAGDAGGDQLLPPHQHGQTHLSRLP